MYTDITIVTVHSVRCKSWNEIWAYITLFKFQNLTFICEGTLLYANFIASPLTYTLEACDMSKYKPFD